MILSALLLVVFVLSAPILWRRLVIARHRDRALVAGELHLGRLGLPNGAVVGVRWTRYRPLSPTVGIPVVVPTAPIGAGAWLGVADVLLTRDPIETQRRVCHSDRSIMKRTKLQISRETIRGLDVAKISTQDATRIRGGDGDETGACTRAGVSLCVFGCSALIATGCVE